MRRAVLVDTHAWLWLVGSERMLSRTARQHLARADTIFLSALSIVEVGMLERKGRLRFDRPLRAWVEEALRAPRVELLGVTREIAMLAAQLRSNVTTDPADHVIAATALVEEVPLLSKDQHIASLSPTLQVIW